MGINLAHATRPMAANGSSRPYASNFTTVDALRWCGSISSDVPAERVHWPALGRYIPATGDERRRLNRRMVANGAFAQRHSTRYRK